MLTQVAEGVLVHESELLQNNTVVVQGRDGVLLIDPGVFRWAAGTTTPASGTGLRPPRGRPVTLGPMRECPLRAVLVATVLGLACVGCFFAEPRDPSGVSIVNASSETVTVLVLYPAGEDELSVYRPGESSVENNMLNANDGCTRFDMVARTDDGTEIDRQPAPICRDDEWRIGD